MLIMGLGFALHSFVVEVIAKARGEKEQKSVKDNAKDSTQHEVLNNEQIMV